MVIAAFLKLLVINLEQMEMSQNVTFVSFGTFYWGSDVNNHVEGYLSITPFWHRF